MQVGWSAYITHLHMCRSFVTGKQEGTFRHLCKGSQRYSVILSTLMQPIVRTASARISGLGSCVSCSGHATGVRGVVAVCQYMLKQASHAEQCVVARAKLTLTKVFTPIIARSG